MSYIANDKLWYDFTLNYLKKGFIIVICRPTASPLKEWVLRERYSESESYDHLPPP